MNWVLRKYSELEIHHAHQNVSSTDRPCKASWVKEDPRESCNIWRLCSKLFCGEASLWRVVFLMCPAGTAVGDLGAIHLQKFHIMERLRHTYPLDKWRPSLLPRRPRRRFQRKATQPLSVSGIKHNLRHILPHIDYVSTAGAA